MAKIERVTSPVLSSIIGNDIDNRPSSPSILAKPNVVTRDDLDRLGTCSTLGPKYTRPAAQRIFCNRDLRLDRIKMIGFDMDFTLAVYKSPAYEILAYDLAKKRLIEMGYPKEVENLFYDCNFAQRGLLVDRELGNMLKIDMFGFIVSCVHGRVVYNDNQIRQIYPSMQIYDRDIGEEGDKRFYVFNTLFNLVDACLLADVVVLLESQVMQTGGCVDCDKEGKLLSPGLHSSVLEISFQNIFSDVRAAIDYVHRQGNLKSETVKDLPKYVERSPCLYELLSRLQKAKKKLFLLTNSGYAYTNQMMHYLLDGYSHPPKDWKEYFDYIIVSAGKPNFFAEGTTLREVDLETGSLKVAAIKSLEKGRVYNGGSMKQFDSLVTTSGPDILYLGDHIFADSIKSKRLHGWRTMLIIRELKEEIAAWKACEPLINKLKSLEHARAEVFRDLDSTSEQAPNIDILREELAKCNGELNAKFNYYFGSLFRHGSKQTFFTMQVLRYADLYSSDVKNLLEYPFFYYFLSSQSPLPHELV